MTPSRSAPTNLRYLIAAIACLGVAGCASAKATGDATADAPTSSGDTAAPDSGPFKTITVIEFAGDDTLFLADSGTGKVHALPAPAAANPAAQMGYNLDKIDAKIAQLLGTTTPNVRVRDLAIHPKSKEAYLAVGRVSGDQYASAVVIANQAGEVRLFDLGAKGTTLDVPFTPAAEFKFYHEFPSRDLTFTDLEFHKGKLYIAGLSNADFASSLWVASYPFGGEVATSTVEIYHTNHNQQETRAPIRTMMITELGGEDYVVAAYTCTPLVVFPLKAVKDGAHINGKVVAELGYGNTPGDLLAFTGQDFQQNKFPVLFLSNKNQSAQIIGMQAVEQAAKGKGLTTFQGFKKSDLQAFDAPMAGVLQADEQDDYHLAALRRDAEQGDLELVSYMKNLYFRLSDFQGEFEFPNYTYPKGSDFVKGLQNQMKADEGYGDLTVE